MAASPTLHIYGYLLLYCFVYMKNHMLFYGWLLLAANLPAGCQKIMIQK